VRFDRVAEDIYVFKSELYLQATATVMLTDEGAIVVDTLPFPQETAELREFVDARVGAKGARYVIETHHHPDHIYGTFMFPEAEVLAQSGCRRALETVGPAMLAQAKRDTPALSAVKLVLPGLTFEEEMDLRLGHRHLEITHAPGHTPDGLGIYVLGEKLLIAGDVLMPVPQISEGNTEQLRATLRRFLEMKPSFVVQGHGGVLLRGEVITTIEAHLAYLDIVEEKVREYVAEQRPPSGLRELDIESCGLSRIPLDGWVNNIHLSNLVSLYKKLATAA